MRSPWIIWVCPAANDKCCHKRHEGDFADTGHGGNVALEAEIGVMRYPSNAWSQKQEQLETKSPLEPLEEVRPCQPYKFGLLASRTEKIKFCCFKSLSLWSFVKAALGANRVSAGSPNHMKGRRVLLMCDGKSLKGCRRGARGGE